jgi:PAS domain S-box-containing protein
LLTAQRDSGNGSFLARSTIDQISRFVSYRTLRDYPVIAAVGTDEQEVLAPLRQREMIYWTAASGASLFILAFCAVVVLALARQRSADQALHLSENRLRLAKTAAGLGVFDRDLVSGKFEYDERAREIWGIASNEALGADTIMAGIHPDDRALVQAALDRALDPQGDGQFRAEYRVVSRADGAMRHAAANGQAFFSAGRAVRLVGTVQDISSEKRLEREYQERRAELEMLVKRQVAVQTAAAIAHELNQPLNAISAYNEVALSMLRSENLAVDKLEQALQRAVQQAQRAGNSLHELLDFLHQGEVAAAPFDLNAMVREALQIVHDEGYGGFQSVLQLDDTLPPVLANRLQIEKVLINLLHNGVEAMREAGIAPGEIVITVRTAPDSNAAQVSVRDSGPALPADLAKRIFAPFFSTKSSGIGLGLAISRALVEANGGQLWHDTTASDGTVFHFTIPLAP